MSGSTSGAGRAAGLHVPRVVASLRGEAAGPTLLAIAGVHGNEPAGLEAAARVLATLEARGPAIRGEFTVLAGNRGALARGVRFVQRDLNRHWTPERVEALRADAARPGVALGPEDREQLELLEAIESARAGSRGRRHVVDLHTTSADGVPFAMLGDRLGHRAFALEFPLPLLLGLLEAIGGTLLGYLERRGWVALGVEAGPHASERSVDHHEAVLWIALVASGVLAEGDAPELGRHRARLAAAWRDLPRALRVYHRHAIAPEDRFVMAPGFANVQRVRRGTILAQDTRGAIAAERDQVLVMPLYQAQGDDGFFLGREIPEPLFRMGAWLGAWGR